LNGKLDLTAVEGLADLIDAETEGQRRQALRQLEGSLGALVVRWVDDLTLAMAHLEALIDFSDEGDVDGAILNDIATRLRSVSAELMRELSLAARGEKIREGFKIAISGPVNAGKSSLLNALARRDVAIVSDIPGTTRDPIEVRIDIAGLPVLLVDTAGLRDTDDPIEALGIARARAAADSADLVLHLCELCDRPRVPGALNVGTKRDLYPSAMIDGFDAVISAETGDGVDELLDLLQTLLMERIGSEDGLITRERHRLALETASRSLMRCESRLVEATLELAAEDVRLALRSLGQITGTVGVEEILDRLFSSFCIGK
jgi:tRNA modification GTPase